jgi:hypothetical protein
MSKHIELVVLAALKEVVESYKIFSLSVNEVIVVDISCRVGIHVCVMEGSKRVLHISYVSEPSMANHFTQHVINALLYEEVLT